MSASQWRRAMNSAASAATRPAAPVQGRARREQVGAREAGVDAPGPRLTRFAATIRLRHVIVLLAVLLFPFVASPFFTYQIGAQSLALGLIALSLTFLGGYGGMVSLAQMTVAGLAGYLVAIFGTSSVAAISLGWPWWLAVGVALVGATVFAAAVGWLSVRTEGIYTIMITLAVGVALFYLAQQNYTLFNGFQGFSKLAAPTVFDVDLREPMPFYFLVLACSAAGYFFIKHL
ncbi:MAG: branched-chain amino acid ABC transporter permease, partial [Burkholderiaceae bacterium]